MRREKTRPISKADRRRLNGGSFGASLLVLACVGAVSAVGWFADKFPALRSTLTYTETQFTGFFQAEAAVPQTQPASLPLKVDFQALTPPMLTVSKSGRLRRNSTLNAVLESLGADAEEAARALQVIYEAELLNPRRLQAGLGVTAEFDAENNALLSVALRPEAERGVFAKRQSDGGFLAAGLQTQLTPQHRRIIADIETSIYEAALTAGAQDQQVADFAQIFAYDIDFQREIHPGDQFEVVYESMVDERGNQIRTGEVLYAELNGRALQRGFYRHTPEDTGAADYFTAEGKSATRFLMKTPINGARLSSSFGRRRHPISGYSRLHKGTDFAAPTGTPIFAAGHGVVERASRYGGYGHYVRIRHANGFKTAYAHMSRYGPGIRSGKRVRQGDVIGYVGSTGASTGPHLHYEVIKNGRHVNAMTLRLPTGRTLEGGLLTAFEATRDEIDAIRDARGRTAPNTIEAAATPTSESS